MSTLTDVVVPALKLSRSFIPNTVTDTSDKLESRFSVPVVFEDEPSLKQTELRPTWTPEEILDLLDIICLFGIKHDIWYLWRPLSRDPSDDLVAELAVTARADAIVTHNVRDFDGMKNFGIKVLKPKEFLVEIGEAR